MVTSVHEETHQWAWSYFSGDDVWYQGPTSGASPLLVHATEAGGKFLEKRALSTTCLVDFYVVESSQSLFLTVECHSPWSSWQRRKGVVMS